MTDLYTRIASLSPEKRTLLELQLLKRGAASDGGANIPRRESEGPCPLSYAQQRLWFLDQFEPNSPLYNIPKAIRLRGALDREALQAALDAIIDRHEALRTTFVSVDGAPLQVIGECRPVELPVLDLTCRPADEREEEVRRLVQEDAERPFDLTRDLMLRAALLWLGDEEHVLLLTMHHIASDRWSMGVLFRELGVLYEAHRTPLTPHSQPNGELCTASRELPLSDLPIQYADYAAWQREWLQGEVLEKQLCYWRRQLAGAPAVLELPTDRPRPPLRTFRGGRQSFPLSRELTESLKALSQREGVTLFMTLLAAFQALLHHYSGQEDVVVGSPIAGRTRLETEGLIGFFVNTLALRSDLSGDPSFRELLRRVQEVALGAYAHQDLPFEKLVEEVQPERNTSHTPLFQVMFALQNAPAQAMELPGMTLSPLEGVSETAKFDLTLVLVETEEGLRGTLEYSRDLFEAATITRMLGHWQTLLSGIVADPGQRVSRLPLLRGAERRQLLVEWNETATEYPRNACIHELFQAQVEQTPEAIALVFEEQSLTYWELNQRANQLARYLQRLGAGPGRLVGLCMERSAAMVVGLLGILKAGAAYVPLDPSYPKERLALMIQDAQVPLLLTRSGVQAFRRSGVQEEQDGQDGQNESSTPERLNPRTPERLKVVCMDSDWPQIVRESGENGDSRTTAESLAYVTYTSGSTGMPNGVGVPHRAVTRLVCNTDYVRLEPSDRVAQASNSSFDAATFEIWGALLHGSRLIGVTQEVALSPARLSAQIREQGITTLFLTTALFNQLAAEAPDAFRPLRHLLFGGEAVDPRWVREVRRTGAPERLLHVYGPTETTTFATWSPVHEVPEGAVTVPIGQPIANTEVYLLDRWLQPVPIGVAGELFIGGDGLAWGYLNSPDLTAERFIPHPFSQQPGARLYRTGDLCRRRPDGGIEFLGRLDRQMKLRGFRIELGEIEAALGQHPEVRECVVVAQEDGAGEKRPVAYVVAKVEGSELRVESSNGKCPNSQLGGELRHFLTEKLPAYLVPSGILILEALPLTPNGKVDRQALLALDVGAATVEGTFVGPRDLLELQLVQIWEKVLGRQRIGVKDNFFELGGHSLLAVRLFAMIRKLYGHDLPLATLFQAPTVERLAVCLQPKGAAPSWSSLVAIKPEGTRPPFFCIHGAGGNVLNYRWLAGYLGTDQPVYGLQSQGLDGRTIGPQQIEEMAAHYLTEIRTIQPLGPYYLGGGSFGGVVAFEMARQLEAQGENVGLVALFDSHAPSRVIRGGLIQRLPAHVGLLRRLGPKDGMSYLLTRVRAVTQKRIVRATWRMSARVRHRLGQPLPRTLRSVEMVNIQAQRRYVPQCYGGRLTLFRARERMIVSHPDPEMGWGPWAAGGVEIHEVPGDHITLLGEPHVQVLAERLTACLQQADADAGSAYEPEGDKAGATAAG